MLTPRGALWVVREDQLATLDQAFREAQALVPSIRKVTADEAVEISPALRRDYLAVAIYEPEAMDMDIHAIHNGYLKREAAITFSSDFITNLAVIASLVGRGELPVATLPRPVEALARRPVHHDRRTA